MTASNDLFTLKIGEQYIRFFEDTSSSHEPPFLYKKDSQNHITTINLNARRIHKIPTNYVNISDVKLTKDGYLLAIEGSEYTLPHKFLDRKIIPLMNSHIEINTVEDYLKFISYLRYVSFYTHLIACLSFGLKAIPSLNNTIICNETGVDFERTCKELTNRIDAIHADIKNYKTKDYKSEDTYINQFCTIIEDSLNKIPDAQDFSCIKTILLEVMASIKKHRDQKVFGYFRGVGVTIYPDSPSAFRPNNDKKEDERYRKMKTKFHDSLGKLPFLDRLSMAEHFGLPTRMLNVSSSPLVALYMACNKIFTGDEKQQATGEIIFYFDGIYDYLNSNQYYTVFDDINYKNETPIFPYKKNYDSGTILVLAALTKLNYENKHRMWRVISTLKHCIEYISDDNKKKEYVQFVNECIHKQAECFEENRYFTQDEIEVYRKLYQSIADEISENPCTNGICKMLSKSYYFTTTSCPYADYNAFRDDFNTFVSSYKYLLATVRRDYISFRDHINIFDLLKSFHVSSGITNERIRAQSGSFILCGLDPDYLKETYLSSRSPNMVRILVKNKEAIFKQLNSLGINDATMLPDMQHYADYLKTI